MMHETLTLREAAALLGLDPSTLRRQIAAGRLAARRHGRDWFVSRREVARYRRDVARPRRPAP